MKIKLLMVFIISFFTIFIVSMVYIIKINKIQTDLEECKVNNEMEIVFFEDIVEDQEMLLQQK